MWPCVFLVTGKVRGQKIRMFLRSKELMDDWMRAERQISRSVPHFTHKVVLWYCWRKLKKHVKEEKRGRERAEPSNPERTKGSLSCMVSIERSTHPHSFIRRAGCQSSSGFPRRFKLLLHTIAQAEESVALAGLFFMSSKRPHNYVLSLEGEIFPNLSG